MAPGALERMCESHGAYLWVRHAGFAALAGACAALVVLYRYEPGRLLYPGCWFHALTGLHCPGCGATRALHALLHGEFWQAADLNAFFVLLGPAVLVWSLFVLYRALRYNRISPPAVPGRVLTSTVVAAVTFAVLRNLPLAPFSLLAP